jgi:hypothetical protein
VYLALKVAIEKNINVNKKLTTKREGKIRTETLQRMINPLFIDAFDSKQKSNC